MKLKRPLLWIVVAWLGASHAMAYEVWMGTHCTPSNAAVYMNTWTNVAARLTGIDAVLAPCLPTAGTPCQNETPCQLAQWKTVFKQLAASLNAYAELPRSSFGPTGPHASTTLTNFLDATLANAATYGYTLRSLMFYDNALTSTNGTRVYYNWTTNEVQQMRGYLNSLGLTNTGLMYDARGYTAPIIAWCTNSLVNDIVLEAAADLWFSNNGARQKLLPWLWTNAATTNKRLIFQIPPCSSPPTYSQTNNFMSTRRLLQWLGSTFMGYDFMRSPRVVFMPVTYNGPTLTFYPETAENGAYYTNTLTSLALSLIEQKNLFEGRTLAPTQADADNMIRYNASRSDLVGYWNCDESSGRTLHGQAGGMDVPLVSGAGFTNGSVAFRNGSVHESGVNNTVSVTGSDLQLVMDPVSGNQMAGLRFANVGVPAGATVTRAYVQFTASSGLTNSPCVLNVQSEAADSATTFQLAAGNLTGRMLNETNIAWTPPGWMVSSESALPERTPELRGALHVVINRPGWTSSNAVAFYVTGTGLRTAYSYDGSPASAPLLHVEWTLDGNGDGIADAWQTQYFGSSSAPNAGPTMDVDGTGLNNLEKYVAGLNPTNPASQLACRVTQTNGQVLVQFDTVQATGAAYQGYTRYYDLQYCTNLMSGGWQGVPDLTSIIGNNATVTYTNNAIRMVASFFRVQVRLQ